MFVRVAYDPGQEFQQRVHQSKVASARNRAAGRMARAIRTALPLIQDMWARFPYAEQPGDDEIMTELRDSAVAYLLCEQSEENDERGGRCIHTGENV